MSEHESRDMDPELDDERHRIVEPMDFDTLRTEPAFERISEAICALLEVSMAHVSVMEDETQCVIGKIGFDRDHFARDQSFCAYALAGREMMIVEDATADGRFANNPYVVDAPYIRFYAGVPLEIQDIPVGTLCAMDDEPGELGARGSSILRELARLVERFLTTTVVASDERDPRYRLGSELTSIAALAGVLDSQLDAEVIGSVVADLKDCVDAGHDAIDRWIEQEHEEFFE